MPKNNYGIKRSVDKREFVEAHAYVILCLKKYNRERKEDQPELPIHNDPELDVNTYINHFPTNFTTVKGTRFSNSALRSIYKKAKLLGKVDYLYWGDPSKEIHHLIENLTNPI